MQAILLANIFARIFPIKKSVFFIFLEVCKLTSENMDNIKNYVSGKILVTGSAVLNDLSLWNNVIDFLLDDDCDLTKIHFVLIFKMTVGFVTSADLVETLPLMDKWFTSLVVKSDTIQQKIFFSFFPTGFYFFLLAKIYFWIAFSQLPLHFVMMKQTLQQI